MSRPDPEIRYQPTVAVYIDSGGYSNSVTRMDEAMFYREWAGVNTPNYSKWSNVPHGLPANDHHSKITIRSVRPIHVFLQYMYGQTPWTSYTDRYQYVVGAPLQDYSFEIQHSPLAIAMARDKVIKKILDRKVNLAQAVAEGQKTIDMVASAATKIAKTLRNLRKGNLAQAARDLTGSKAGAPRGSSVAKNWLELQYGWKPLLSDIYGACETLAARTQPPILKFRAKATTSDSKRVYVDSSHPNESGTVTNKETGYTSTAKIVVAYAMGSQTPRTMSQLGISDPLSLAWELLPYSFVVDWFLPVGDYLASLGYDTGLSFRMGSEVRISKNCWEVNMESRTKDFGNGTFSRFTYDGCSIVTSRNVLLDRVHLTASPSPSLPSFKNPLNIGHMLNALALLRGAVR